MPTPVAGNIISTGPALTLIVLPAPAPPQLYASSKVSQSLDPAPTITHWVPSQ
ncbi:MAG: hypothetical protein BWX59_02290 [Bacteroidetes bacterium ADurb.Bin028]|nr:MAG: hypothetical protein BWX59_02290 [Bacteroidetes bacterium ADurb.Bin028]